MSDEILTREQELEKALRGMACCIEMHREVGDDPFCPELTCHTCPFSDVFHIEGNCLPVLVADVRRLLGLEENSNA